MNSIRKTLYAALTVALVSLAACFGGNSTSSATDDDSTYATTAQLTALQTQVTQAFAQLKLVGVAKGQTASVSAATARLASVRTEAAATNPCTNLGTLISASPFDTSQQTYKSCTGYFGQVDVTSGAWVQPSNVYYDAPGCVGNIFVTSNPDPTQGLSPTLLASGEIMQIGGATGSTYYVAANSASQSFNAQSGFTPAGSCVAVNATFTGYPLVLNAGGAVSGENDGPVPLPISTVAPTP